MEYEAQLFLRSIDKDVPSDGFFNYETAGSTTALLVERVPQRQWHWGFTTDNFRLQGLKPETYRIARWSGVLATQQGAMSLFYKTFDIPMNEGFEALKAKTLKSFAINEHLSLTTLPRLKHPVLHKYSMPIGLVPDHHTLLLGKHARHLEELCNPYFKAILIVEP